MQNPVDTAREWIGRSRYVFLTEECQPPYAVNCFIFIYWIYAQCGIFLPETLEGQLYAGVPIISSDLWENGDLIFRGESHWGAYYDNDRAKDGVGHVGILTSDKKVIHASWKTETVVEETLENFLANGLKKSRFRGVYRI